MRKHTIRIDQGTDLSRVLRDFSEFCEGTFPAGVERDVLLSRVTTAVDDFWTRANRLLDTGSYLEVKQTIEHPLCRVLIDVDFVERKPLIPRIRDFLRGKS
nr:hypothetical protein 2 [Desulfobacterales bacterium]